MTNFWYIERLVMAAVLLLLLAVAPAMAQDAVYQGETTTLSVEQNGADTYQWELYSDSTVNFAVEPGDPSPTAYAEFIGPNEGPMVQVQWNKPGTYFYKVTALDAAGCAMNLKIMKIRIMEALPTVVITPPDPNGVCEGEEVKLEVTLTGKAPWSFTYTDGINEWEVTDIQDAENPYLLLIDPRPLVTTEYWITKVTDSRGTNTEISNKVTQQINPLPSPTIIYHR